MIHSIWGQLAIAMAALAGTAAIADTRRMRRRIFRSRWLHAVDAGSDPLGNLGGVFHRVDAERVLETGFQVRLFEPELTGLFQRIGAQAS